MDASEKQLAKAQPEQGTAATLGQKIFIVLLYLYILSLVWLTLSHYWYGCCRSGLTRISSGVMTRLTYAPPASSFCHTMRRRVKFGIWRPALP